MQPEIVETKSSDGRSVISSSAVAAIVERLKFERNRSSTRRNYHTIWKIFSDFYLRLDEKPDNWEDRIVLFTAYLINKNMKVATAKSYVSAIKSVLREDTIAISDDRFVLNSMIMACRYRNNQTRLHFPIQKPLLLTILKQIRSIYLDGNSQQPYLSILSQAMISTLILRVAQNWRGD